MEAGIQISSLKPLLLTPEDVKTAFRRCAQLGCRVVQLQWVDASVPIPVIGAALKESGMRSVSVQDFYETVLGDFEYYVNLNSLTRGTWLCVRRIPDRFKSETGLEGFVAELRQMQKKLDKFGQKLCFHPVSADFAAIPGRSAVEDLLEKMPELALCLDLYHLNRNCADMPAFIRKYGSRICMVHFKDEKAGSLVPAGRGDVNWEGVVKACLEEKVPYGFAEQETWEKDPYACLQAAMDWLEEEIRNEETK